MLCDKISRRKSAGQDENAHSLIGFSLSCIGVSPFGLPDNLEKFLDVSPNHLIKRRVSIEVVPVDDDFHAHLAPLVAGQFVVQLHVVKGQVEVIDE